MTGSGFAVDEVEAIENSADTSRFRPNRGVTRQNNKVTCWTKLVTGRKEKIDKKEKKRKREIGYGSFYFLGGNHICAES